MLSSSLCDLKAFEESGAVQETEKSQKEHRLTHINPLTQHPAGERERGSEGGGERESKA